MGNGALQNGVQKPQARVIIQVLPYQTRIYETSDEVEAAIDKCQEEYDKILSEIDGLEQRRDNASSEAAREFCDKRLQAKKRELNRKGNKLEYLTNKHEELLNDDLIRANLSAITTNGVLLQQPG